MKAAAKQLAEDTNGDGKCDKYCFEVYGNDTFHYSQPLFQAGGSLLNADNTAPAFNSPEGLSALEYYKSFLDDGSGDLLEHRCGRPHDRDQGRPDRHVPGRPLLHGSVEERRARS